MTAAATNTADDTLEAPVVENLADRRDREKGEVGQVIIEREGLQRLIDVLGTRGFTVVAPTVRDEAIVYDEIASETELPIGWTDLQAGGTYRLTRRGDAAVFGYAVGPHSWKKYLHPSTLLLWRSRVNEEKTEIEPNLHDGPKVAFLGVRPCELKAIAIQDRVFLGGPYVDASYRARRDRVMIVAVNCGTPASTCFCTSMNAGPAAGDGYDLLLTEVVEGKRHYFVASSGTKNGAKVLADVATRPAESAESAAARGVTEMAAQAISKTLPMDGVKELLYRNTENRQWDKVAARCLTCGNCTQVCPTCFCTTVEDITDLTGSVAERWRRWDSCFTTDFSYIHGGSVRTSARARYRQWITHKLAAWQDQFGSAGCVGCGRCITWCPVGIDISEEVRAIRDSERN